MATSTSTTFLEESRERDLVTIYHTSDEEDVSSQPASGPFTQKTVKLNTVKAEEGGNYLAVADARAAETTKCLDQARKTNDYLSALPAGVLKHIIHHVFKDQLLVVGSNKKDKTGQAFSGGERCQLLLTSKTIHAAAKPIFYGLINFCFRDVPGLDRFTTVETWADYQRVLLVKHVRLAHLALVSSIGEKVRFPNLALCKVIANDIDEEYEADGEDEERSGALASSIYRKGWW